MIDLLVVGGGPAGLVTALHAQRQGLQVVVVEQRHTPVDKACGEGLMPGAVRGLADLEVVPTGHRLRGIRYLDGARAAEAHFRAGAGLGVRRTTLHAALLDRVDQVGIPLLRRTVGAIEQNGRSVSAGGVTARYLAAADGLHSPIRRRLGLEVPDRRPRRYGQRRHFAVAAWTDLVEVHWARRAEAYVTPVSPGLVGVAVLSGERRPYDELLRGFPLLVDRLAGCEAGTVRGAGPLRQRVRTRVAGRVLLVGDAAGYVDALTGEGIAVASTSAQALVQCVAADRPQDYERRWRRASRQYRVITEALLGAVRVPVVRSALVPAATRFPAVFEGAVARLAA